MDCSSVTELSNVLTFVVVVAFCAFVVYMFFWRYPGGDE